MKKSEMEDLETERGKLIGLNQIVSILTLHRVILTKIGDQKGASNIERGISFIKKAIK